MRGGRRVGAGRPPAAPEQHARRALSRALTFLKRLPPARVAHLVGADEVFRDAVDVLVKALIGHTQLEQTSFQVFKAPPDAMSPKPAETGRKQSITIVTPFTKRFDA